MIETENRPADRPEQITEPLADVNADLTQRVVVDTQRMTWESSPSGTVSRKPLYRRGGESGPVTSLVRYAPGGAFPEHAHPQGEEILVLEGEFGDEHGRYPEGTWIRSPHMSQHSPFFGVGLPDLCTRRRSLNRS
jgi:anti-sigma factor ChrR (cupin superfamily)